MDSTEAYQDSGRGRTQKENREIQGAGASNPGPCDCAKRQVADRGIGTDVVPDRRQVRPSQLATGNRSRPDEPWHDLRRQIGTGGLHCPDLTQRRLALFSLAALYVGGLFLVLAPFHPPIR